MDSKKEMDSTKKRKKESEVQFLVDYETRKRIRMKTFGQEIGQEMCGILEYIVRYSLAGDMGSL
jgi:hypothetical protein